MTNYNELRDGQEFFGNGYKKGYKEGYKQAILDGKTNFSRPQGEWIKTQEDRWTYPICSECGYKENVVTNYCANCGAKMDKEDK